MRIAIDASRYGHKYATGVEWYSFHIINQLIEENKEHEIILYTRDKIGIKENELLKIVIIPSKRLWTLWGLSYRLYKDKVDCLFVPSHTFPLYLPKKRYIMIHDLAFKRYREAYSFFQYLYLDLTTRFACKFASKIITPSLATKNDLINFYNCNEKKISVVYHGFSPPEKKDNKKYFFDNFKFLLFIGRIEVKKNVSGIVSAFKILKNKFPDLKLILAGKPGVGYDSIIKSIEESGVKDSIFLTGYIDEEQKNHLYKKALCFVFPSLYEGFGLPVLEAFYHKCPVVCANSGSLPEVCLDACLLSGSMDTNDLRNKIEKIISNKEYKENMTKKGFERLKDFSWKKSAKSTFEIISNQNDNK